MSQYNWLSRKVQFNTAARRTLLTYYLTKLTPWIVAYLTTFPVALIIQRPMIGWLANDELETMRNRETGQAFGGRNWGKLGKTSKRRAGVLAQSRTRHLQVASLACCSLSQFPRQIPISTAFIEQLTVAQLAKKFSVFYETRRFMTLYTRAHHWFPILSQMNPVHTLPSSFFKVTLSSRIYTLVFQAVILPSVFPTKTSYVFLHSYACYIYHSSYWFWSS
jgi:hypothetical protein